jgi:hypothetical protein
VVLSPVSVEDSAVETGGRPDSGAWPGLNEQMPTNCSSGASQCHETRRRRQVDRTHGTLNSVNTRECPEAIFVDLTRQVDRDRTQHGV